MTAIDFTSPEDFVQRNTRPNAPPLVPEIRLYSADEIVPIWQLTEQELSQSGLPPPFWAFAWAGGQALARYVLDHPETVRGKRVLDFAAGSGIVGIAAAKAGAAHVSAADIDPFAAAACELNAQINDTLIHTVTSNLVGCKDQTWEVVLTGDICYEQPLARRVEAWLRQLATGGAIVLIGDPGRTYLPKQGVEKVATYKVLTTRELEDADVRNTSVWRVLPADF